jgi:hypothetical protein
MEFPNAAIWLIRYLSVELPKVGYNVPVVGEVPTTRPASFVHVENAGGNGDIVTDSALLLVGSWDTTNPKAERLASKVRALIRAAAGVTVQGEYCKGSDVSNRPVYIPDPDAKVPRYRQTVSLSFRGVVTNV